MGIYSLSFVFYEDNVILLNREKPPWMGIWNGLGGKIEDESIIDGAKRELREELNLRTEVEICGTLDWYEDEVYKGRLYITKSTIDTFHRLPEVSEGLLAYKPLDWILHEKNKGIARNITIFLKDIKEGNIPFSYTSYYVNDEYIKTVKGGIE
jgi:8-oxo-dGTP diphosphatase